MFSSTDEIIRRIQDIYKNYQWLISYQIEQKSVSILKAKIIFSEEIFIQIYVNIRKPKIIYQDRQGGKVCFVQRLAVNAHIR